MSSNSVSETGFRSKWFLWGSVMALTGMILILAITRFGPGASGDSAYYLMGAHNLIAGDGFSRTSGGGETKPITGFPPGFSAVLAILGSTGGDLFQVGRYLNVGLFAVNILLAGGLVFHYTRKLGPTLFACGVLLASEKLVFWHAWIMSEPLYIALTLGGLFAITRFFENGRRLVLIGAGLLLAASTLTRYVGAALLFSFALSILVFSKARWRRRIVDSAILAGVALGPVYLWLRWNVAVAGTGVNRQVLYHPMGPELVRAFLGAASSWFVPDVLGLPMFLRAAISLLVAITIPAVFFIRSLRERRDSDAGEWRGKYLLPWILLLSVASYLVVLVINSTFLDASTTLSAPPRYLLPVFVMVVVLFACAISRLLDALRLGRGWRWGAGLAAMALIAAYLPATVNLVRDPIPNIGYTGLRYSLPAVVDRLEDVSTADPIISNNPELVFILVGRPAYMRPIRFDAYQLKYREDFASQVSDTQAKLDSGAVLVLFGSLDSEEMYVLQALNVTATYKSAEASFYVSANAADG
jgi:hypothetical protein